MITVAVPDLLVSTVEVAVTVMVPSTSPMSTIKTPLSMVVSAPLFPLTDHVTVWAGLLVPVTAALKVWVPPLATVGAAGLMVTLVTVGSRLPGGMAGSKVPGGLIGSPDKLFPHPANVNIAAIIITAKPENTPCLIFMIFSLINL
jgi:hypothetical protein